MLEGTRFMSTGYKLWSQLCYNGLYYDDLQII